MRELTVLEKHGFRDGRLIGWSKSGYRRAYPNHDVVFNANIFTPSGKNFHGDLDITKDCLPLQRACNDLGEEMIILFESLGWGAEKKTYEELEVDAHAKFTPNKRYYAERKYGGIHGVKSGNMTVITGKGIDWRKVRVRKWSQSYKTYDTR
jgi:hypothetical protein